MRNTIAFRVYMRGEYIQTLNLPFGAVSKGDKLFLRQKDQDFVCMIDSVTYDLRFTKSLVPKALVYLEYMQGCTIDEAVCPLT